MLQDQEDVDFTLHNLLQIFYNNSESSHTIDNTPTITKQQLKFLNASLENIESLKSQMSLKLKNGYGEARYIIGIFNNSEDEGITKSEMYEALSKFLFIE